MNVLESINKNLEALRRVDPEAAEIVGRAAVPADAQVIPSRSGAPTLIVAGLTLHSRFDPWAEARAFTASPEVAAALNGKTTPTVLGWGLGYHIIILADLFPELNVIEPDPGLVRLAFEHLDFSGVIPRIKLMFQTYPEDMAGQDAWIRHGPSIRRKRAGPSLSQGEDSSSRMVEKNKVSAGWANIPGAGRVPAAFGPDERIGFSQLVETVRGRRGPLTECEAYILLLDELTPAGRANNGRQ